MPAPTAATVPAAETPSAVGGRSPTSHDPSLTRSSHGATPAARTVMSVSPAPAGRGSGSDSSRTSSPNRSIPAAFTRPPACRPDYPSLDTPSPAPVSPGRRRRPSDELELGRAREPLDAGLLAERGGSVRHRKDRRQLDRQAAPRVAAGGARPVGGQ